MLGACGRCRAGSAASAPSTGNVDAVAPNSGDMFEIVARSATVRAPRPGPKNSMNLPTTPCWRSRSVIVSTRSVAVTPLARPPDEAHADHLRRRHVDRLAEHDRLGLDPADAPAEHPEGVDHRRVGVGADERVGHRHAVADGHHRAQVLEVHLVDDPHPRRNDPEVAEGALRPPKQGVALAVSPVLMLDVALVGAHPSRTRRPARSGRRRGRRAPADRHARGRRRAARRPSAAPPGRRRRGRRSGPA